MIVIIAWKVAKILYRIRLINLLNFGEKHLLKYNYTMLLGPTHLLVFEIFPSQPDFH